MPRNPLAVPAARRLFTPTGVVLATLFGSLIAGVATLWFNYRVLGYQSLANRTAAVGLIFYMMVLTASSMTPNTALIAAAVLLGQCVVTGWAAHTLQGPAIAYHQAHGGAVFSSGWSALVGLLIGIVAVVMLLLIGIGFGLPIGLR